MISWLLLKYLPAYQCRKYGAGSSVAGGGGALPLLCSFASRVDRVCSDVCLNWWLWWRRALRSARGAGP